MSRIPVNAGGIVQARAYADPGVSIARLRLGDLLAARPGPTTLQGCWLGASQVLPMVGGVATARVTDGGNCFNLNSVVAGESESDLKVRPVAVTQFQGLMQTLASTRGRRRRSEERRVGKGCVRQGSTR